jgi:hypothetical protein
MLLILNSNVASVLDPLKRKTTGKPGKKLQFVGAPWNLIVLTHDSRPGNTNNGIKLFNY